MCGSKKCSPIMQTLDLLTPMTWAYFVHLNFQHKKKKEGKKKEKKKKQKKGQKKHT